MGTLSFVIGFIVGWLFLSSFISDILPAEIGGVCLRRIDLIVTSLCLFRINLIGPLTGLVMGFIFYKLIK